MIDYGIRILFLSGIIAAVTAFLLFLAVRQLLVTPIRRVVEHMTAYAAAPRTRGGSSSRRPRCARCGRPRWR